MIHDGWLAENRHRAYPFIEGGVGLPIPEPPAIPTLMQMPNSIIVDAGFRLGPLAHFDPTDPLGYVLLYKIERVGNTIFFYFSTLSQISNGIFLVFSRLVSAPQFMTDFAELAPQIVQSLSEQACDEPIISGFLTTGTMADIDLVLPGDGTLIGGGGGICVVEPGTIQNLSQSVVSRIGVANIDRTRATSQPPCDAIIWPYPLGGIHIYDTCLAGDLRILKGYNCDLRQDDLGGAITITPLPGAGEGQPCAEVPLFKGEVPPDGSPYLSGGPGCHEVLKSINGIGGPEFELSGGLGVTVTSFPGLHWVRISHDLSGIAACPESIPSGA